MAANPLIPSRRPWHPVEYATEDIYALQNLAKGNALPHQQQRALTWILRACAVDQPTFYPDSDRETVFAEAKRHVGLEIRKLLNLPPRVIAALAEAEKNPKRRQAKETDNAE